MRFGIHKNKSVYAQQCKNDHCNVEQISTGQNDAEIANLFRYDFVLKGIEAKHVRLFNIVETLGTLVHGLLRQTDEEWHHQHTQESKNEYAEHCE